MGAFFTDSDELMSTDAYVFIFIGRSGHDVLLVLNAFLSVRSIWPMALAKLKGFAWQTFLLTRFAIVSLT